jgi:predicted ester cyclase
MDESPPGTRHIDDFFPAWEQAMGARDAARVASMCTEDIVWEESVLQEPLHGRAAVRDFLDDYLFRPMPNFRFEILELIVSEDGTRAADRARFSGTLLAPVAPLRFAPTGHPVQFEVAAFFEFRDGAVAHFRLIVDMLDVVRQAGAAPRRGTLGDRLSVRLQHWTAARLRRRRSAAGAGSTASGPDQA